MLESFGNTIDDAIKNMKNRMNNARKFSLIHKLAKKKRNAERKAAWDAKNHKNGGSRKNRKSRKNRHTKRRH